MKKYLSVLLAIAIMLMSIPLSSAALLETTEPIIYIDDYEAAAGDSLEIAVKMENNPGITALSFDVEYDSEALELVEATDGRILGSSTALFGKDIETNPYRLCWDDLSTENNKGNGTLAYLVFLVRSDAGIGKTDIKISLNENSTFNVDLENVSFEMRNGSVDIVGSKESVPTISVSDVSASRGEEFETDIVLENNVGITALSFDIDYDREVLELVKAEDGKILGNSTSLFGNDVTAVPYRLCWDDLSTENHTENGTVAVLTFRVLENANIGKSEIKIKLNQGSTFNVDFEDVFFETHSGFVNVTDSVSEENNAEIILGSDYQKNDEQFDVNVIIRNNPGITALSFDISYDKNVLRLVGAEDKKLLGNSVSVFGNDLSMIPYRLCWDDLSTENHTENGTVAVLRFEVIPGSTDETCISISLDQGSTFNVDMNDVYFETSGTKVKIENELPTSSAATTEPTTTTTTSTATTATTKPTTTTTISTATTATTEPTTTTTSTTTTATTKLTTATTSTTTTATTEPTTTAPAEQNVKIGDVNGDKKIDSSDASLILVEFARIQTGEKPQFTEEQFQAADVNLDGKIDSSDASIILVYYAYIQTGGEVADMKVWYDTVWKK